MNAQLFLAYGFLICIVAAFVFAWNGRDAWGWFLLFAVLLASAIVG
ncbi:MAG: hypothetical protein PGN20_15230 [Agrobacterium cavarae]